MGKKRQAIQTKKQKQRADRFEKSGGEGHSKYRTKQAKRNRNKTSPFYNSEV